MINVLIAAMVAAGLILTGWFSLTTIKDKKAKESPIMVFDFEPYCDDDSYLTVGQSFDATVLEIMAAKENKKPLVVNDGKDFVALKYGQTFHSILRPNKVSAREIHKISVALKPHFRARDITVGTLYRFKLINVNKKTNLVKNFQIKKLDSNRIPVFYRVERVNKDPDNPSFTVKVEQPEIETTLDVVELAISGSLYQSFMQLPFGNELMQRVMEVFVWTIRMPQEVYKGDTVRLLVTKKYALDDFVGYGKIISAEYKQKHRSFTAIYFSSSDQKIKGYFDENGNSLEREFLYSPVYETTATSNQKWRLHPIKKVRIRHNGIDYRGSVGTDFFSIADGQVAEKRFDRNVGNMIRVKHKYGVYSEYFHADSLVDGIKVNDSVERGQKLGTIGKTGRLCTGPHLHMGLYKFVRGNKQFISLKSLRRTLKPEPDLPSEYLAEFQTHHQELMARIDGEHELASADR